MIRTMRAFYWLLKLLSLLTAFSLTLLTGNPTFAQITPDDTLQSESSKVTLTDVKGLSADLIEGGAARGVNLFHSFSEFNVREGQRVYFANPAQIQNILSRVTGSDSSKILGTLGVLGDANLFFLNPNGIIFGRNASLDLGGSFLATTADSFQFKNGFAFSASNPQAPPLMIINVPVGLQFGLNSGEIVNRSQASPDGAINSNNSPVGLQVASGMTLALVGGKVSLEGGNLTSAGGRIELGSVAGNGFVSLDENQTGYALGYTNVQNFEDIQLSRGANVDTSDFNVDVDDSGGGAIQLQGRNISLTEQSLIFSITFGSKKGEDLIIHAAESAYLSDGSVIATFTQGKGQAGDVLVRALNSMELVGTTSDGSPSFLASQVCLTPPECQSVTGNGGNLTIETGRLQIRDGAAIDASTFGAGRAGNVLVKASDSIALTGISSNAQFPSGIFAQVGQNAIDNPGDAGTLRIETKRLTVQGGAQISTAARKGGNGGTLTINASDSIELIGSSPFATAKLLDNQRSGIFVSAEQGATGNAGNLNITTGLFTIEDGARISADNIGSGSTGGNATLDVRQLMIRDGGEVRAGSFGEGPGGSLTVNATKSVEVIGTGEIGSTPVKSTLFTQAQGTGNAGDLNIFTPNLTVRDGGEVNVSATGSGEAGDLQINADSIQLDRGTLTAATASGEGGNIRLKVDDLLFLENNSLISAKADGTANGGNIDIDAGFVIAAPNQNSDIIANASKGRGGNINITTQGIFNIEERKAIEGNSTNDIDASSEFGLAGTVTINSPDVDPSRKLVRLPNVPVTVEVAQGCQAEGKQASAEFFNTGKGGLAPSPYEPLSSSNIWEDIPPPRQETANSANEKSTSTSPDKIIEAQGWQIDKKGEVTLVAEVPNTLSQSRCRLH